MVQPAGTRILKVRQPLQGPVRILLVVTGLFACIVPQHQLFPGIWPPNIATPFFALIIGGALCVGAALLNAGLFGRSALWTIRPGHIRIVTRQPFGPTEILSFDPSGGAWLEVEKDSFSDGPDNWCVALVTPEGKHYRMNPLRTPEQASLERERIDQLFRSHPVA